MTYQNNCTLPAEIVAQIADQGMEALPELMRIMINQAMELERQKHLKAAHYERTPERRGMPTDIKQKR